MHTHTHTLCFEWIKSYSYTYPNTQTHTCINEHQHVPAAYFWWLNFSSSNTSTKYIFHALSFHSRTLRFFELYTNRYIKTKMESYRRGNGVSSCRLMKWKQAHAVCTYIFGNLEYISWYIDFSHTFAHHNKTRTQPKKNRVFHQNVANL